VIVALKTCYGVMKTASDRNLPHFGVERCGDGVFAEWLRVNAKKQLSFSAFGRQIGLMCRSRSRQLDDKLFEHGEYAHCIAALGRQAALKSGFDFSRTVTLCNQLTPDDRALCTESGQNFTAVHEDSKFYPLPACERSPANQADFRSTATLVATPIGSSDGEPADVLHVAADWFDIASYRAWQDGEFVDMLDPLHPAVYDDPDAPPVESPTDELQRPDGRRRRRRQLLRLRSDSAPAEPQAPLNYSVTEAGSLVHARLRALLDAQVPFAFYVEWDARASLDVAFLINDTLPTLTSEAALERVVDGGRWSFAMYVTLGVGALLAAALTWYQFWLRSRAGQFKSVAEER
jgi:hypothetical protein